MMLKVSGKSTKVAVKNIGNNSDIPYDTNVAKLQEKKRCYRSYIKVTAGQSFEPGNLDMV